MFRAITAVLFCVAYAVPASAGEYKFCLLVNKVAPAGKLRDYTNSQIENGLCMTSKEIMNAIVANDSFKEEICTEAAQYMMEEFKRRFPNRAAKEVVGKC